MPAEQQPRNEAGLGGDDTLADKVAELEARLERTQTRQRAMLHALVNIAGFTSAELSRLTAD